MSGGFCSPTTCGFAKVAAVEASKSARSAVKKGGNNGSPKSQHLNTRYEIFRDIFQDHAGFAVDIGTFNKRFPALQATVNNWTPKKKLEKEMFFNTFAVDQWLKLSPSKRREHCFTNCEGCYQSYSQDQALFPVRCPRLKSKAKENPFVLVTGIMHTLNSRAEQTVPIPKAVDGAKEICNALNPALEKWSGVPLGQALTKVSEANVERKRSPEEKKKAHRDLLRKAKAKVEENWRETSVLRCLGNRQSYASRQRDRMASSFESRQAAKERRDLYMLQVREGKKKEKNHSGNLEKLAGLDNLKLEVEGYTSGIQINWSALARNYNIRNKRGELAKNGDQIVKDWLVSQGMDVNQFSTEDKQREKQPRRRKLRGVGGEIAVPSAETNDAMKNALRAKIENGQYTVGELIVPKKYEKLLLDKEGSLKKEEFTVEGRKGPWMKSAQKTMLKHKEYTRQHPDEYYDEMSQLEVSRRLAQLNEFDDTEGLTVMCQKLKKIERETSPCVA